MGMFGSFNSEMRTFGTLGFVNLFLARAEEGIPRVLGDVLHDALKEVGDETFENMMMFFQRGDESWEPLSRAYRLQKIMEGKSDMTWRRNDDLMKNIVSFEVGPGVWFVGWLRGKKNSDGEDMGIIAETLEFGWDGTMRNDIPPRPLVRPAAEAAMRKFEKRLKNGLRDSLIKDQRESKLFFLGRQFEAGQGV